MVFADTHMWFSSDVTIAGSADKIDRSIASLAIIAQLQERDLWTVVQTMPHLFSVGGLFYDQVKRDLGLVDGKHCTVPKLPGKVRHSSLA